MCSCVLWLLIAVYVCLCEPVCEYMWCLCRPNRLLCVKLDSLDIFIIIVIVILICILMPSKGGGRGGEEVGGGGQGAVLDDSAASFSYTDT